MSPNKLPKIESLVVQAIRRLQDVEGSTAREISNYISQEYDVPGTEVRRQVELALRRGLSYRILQRSKGGHYTYNRDFTERPPTDAGVSHCRGRRSRSRRTKRSRRSGRNSKRRGRSRGCGHRRGRRRSGKRKSRHRRSSSRCGRSRGKRRAMEKGETMDALEKSARGGDLNAVYASVENRSGFSSVSTTSEELHLNENGGEEVAKESGVEPSV